MRYAHLCPQTHHTVMFLQPRQDPIHIYPVCMFIHTHTHTYSDRLAGLRQAQMESQFMFTHYVCMYVCTHIYTHTGLRQAQMGPKWVELGNNPVGKLTYIHTHEL